MAALIPDIEPEKFTQGETVKWTKSLSDFNASDGYVLTYEFAGGSTVTPIIGTPNGDDWDISIASATTAAYRVGVLFWQAFVALAGERYKVGDGRFTIEQDLGESNDYDGRTIAEKILAAIDANLEGTASKDQKKYKIGDVEIEKFAPADLLNQRDYWNQIVGKQKRIERLKAGKSTTNTIKTRFTWP